MRVLHHTTTALHLRAGGCVAETEECVINIAKVVCREKAHTKESFSALLCSVGCSAHQMASMLQNCSVDCDQYG